MRSSRVPEITWSLMHPVQPTAAYMREVIAAAAHYHVDSFEICGDAHSSSGNLDGAIRFRDYPVVAAQLDQEGIAANVAALREVATLAHESGRPVLYWHREVMVPRPVVDTVPGLLDEYGEFNLLGTAYHDLLRSKIREFFDNVPEIDGVVLTVTESDFSVIHNSDPDRYPPVRVIQEVASTFARELTRLGKRFVLRSFGSIAQDYEDILAGAALADFPFEIETKITPYDFSPFMPLNPFLRATGERQLSAEYDSIGEFLGAGFLPAPDPARVVECVAYARAQNVDRHVIRIDRIGHATFASTQAINLFAFDRAIRDPSVTAETIWQEWARTRWPRCTTEMIALMQQGLAVTKKTHFIDGHVIFHAFPIHPEMKWLKACGILSLFQPDTSLGNHVGMWGILTDRTTPARVAILQEKDEAVRLADEGLATLRSLQTRLTPAEFSVAEAAWRHATKASRLIRAWCQCVCAYFDDMERRQAGHPALDAALAAARPEFESILGTALPADAAPTATAVTPPAHEYGNAEEVEDTFQSVYAKPLWKILLSLRAEFRAEFDERARWLARSDVVDFVVCGGVTYDFRVHRYMHASHAPLLDGKPARIVGNRVFPNGFIECRLKTPSTGRFRLVISGSRAKSDGFLLLVNEQRIEATYDAAGNYEFIPAQPTTGGTLVVRLQKLGARYPWIHTIAVTR